jgi:hypothetical protein
MARVGREDWKRVYRDGGWATTEPKKDRSLLVETKRQIIKAS